mmetsp:Transcript_7037/g.7728  ORF Transcript_7037/g.7728 Transcript_7037/m.7728 type:complete len:210 (-) Transcript_7037:30-659(-)
MDLMQVDNAPSNDDVLLIQSAHSSVPAEEHDQSEEKSSSATDQDQKDDQTKDSDEEEVWEVEKIINMKHIKGKVHYEVKWKGWPHSSNTWEPREHVKGCKEALEKFHKQNLKKYSGGKRKYHKKCTIQNKRLKKSSMRKILQTQEKIHVGFKHGDKVEEIVGVVVENGKLYFYVKWCKKTLLLYVPKEDMYKHAPDKTLAFYEKRLQFE